MAYLNHLHQQQYHHAAPGFHHNQQQQHSQQQQHRQAMMGTMGMGMMDSEEDRMEARAAEELLDSDSHHELMLGTNFLPCPNTVIVGRGKKVAQHAGNVRFRELVKKELAEYSAATTKAHKSSIIVRVLNEIRRKSHYAFVKQNLTTGRWYRVEETAQRITTAQAFRDALKDNYKSSRAFKKLKREEEKKTNSTDDKAKEKKEKKKAATKEKKKAAAAKPPPPAPKAIAAPAAAPSAVVPSAAASAGGGAAKKPGKSIEDLRSMLEQSQTALVSGNFSWWDPNAVTTAPMDEDSNTGTTSSRSSNAKMPPPSAIPSTSVSSCSSLLWSNHSKPWSNHSRKYQQQHHQNHQDNNKPRSRAHDVSMSTGFSMNQSAAPTGSGGASGIKWSNHSIRTMSNHSIMTISGHSTRSNSTFNGLVTKYAPDSNADMTANPFEPTPIPSSVREDAVADVEDMDMDMDDCEELQGPAKQYVPRATPTFDEGVAMGLGNLSDHSLMSNMSSMHSVKGFTAEEIFADSNHNGKKEQRGCPPTTTNRRYMNFAMSA